MNLKSSRKLSLALILMSVSKKNRKTQGVEKHTHARTHTHTQTHTRARTLRAKCCLWFNY